MDKPLWKPTSKNSAMQSFMRQTGHNNYSSLHKWSITKPSMFWQAVADFCALKFNKPTQAIFQAGEEMHECRWFVGAELNFAENLLSRRDDHPAIIAASEQDAITTISYTELSQKVASVAAQFQQLGLKPGERVAAVLPNTADAIIAMLASASLGGVWSACSPDFGLEGLIDRFAQIEPRFLILAESHTYKGKTFDHTERNKNLLAALPSVEQIIDLDYSAQSELIFQSLPFDHPLYILYSSGTTGKPKCMVHGAGGTLIQHLKELKLHTDVGPNSTLFFNTTTTWMMWHWLVSSLALGATVVLYEGNVLYPKSDRLFDLIDQVGINFFGVGAKYFETTENLGLEPIKTHHLKSLQAILTTASPLLPASFDYVYRSIKKQVRLSSISGGSDIISCFALGNPALPVYRGEIQCLGLGMNVKIFNAQGKSVAQEKGELVCTSPFPSMPIYFWNDPDGSKYFKAYFSQFPHVWAHGDYAEITEHNGLIIYGRSDATLNPSGVRIGSAEIYQQIEKMPEIEDAVVAGHNYQGNERIVLFVILRAGVELDKPLKQAIRKQIRENTSPHHVPAVILPVEDIPRTANGKISEVTVKKLINGEPIDNLGALANPACLAQYTPERVQS